MELKNGDTYNGTLVSCDSWMNINLKDVICTSRVCVCVCVSVRVFLCVSACFCSCGEGRVLMCPVFCLNAGAWEARWGLRDGVCVVRI